MNDRAAVRRPFLPRLNRRPARLLGPLLLAAALALLPVSASAAEITGFISGAQPDANWGRGWGGMLTISVFTIVNLEIEGARQGGGALTDTSMLSIAGKAYIGPAIGRFVPYFGLGGGAYRESLPSRSDNGTLGLVFAGAKLKFPFGLVIRGEYQWVSLPDTVLLKMDHRYFAAAGISF